MKLNQYLPAVAGLLATIAIPLGAQDISPNFNTAAFYTDRYAPAQFQVNDGVHGRDDVLQIGINSTTDLANRGAPYQSTFYNTQGMKTNVNTTGSWMFQSDLYVENTWATARSGYVRTDMWATATDNPAFSGASAYPIVGFTNFDGAARFRGYDVNTGLWVDFNSSVNFGAWNTLGMGFDAGTNTFSYFVNGTLAGSIVGGSASTGVANVMYQAYNFNDPAYVANGANPAYVADWSATSSTVPEPSTYALMVAGLAGVFAVRRRQTARKVATQN